MRLTFGQLKNSLARVAAGGICPSDDRLKDRLNESIQRLLPIGNWISSLARYDFCVVNSCISLPSKFDTLIGYTSCSGAGSIHPMTYRFRENGPSSLGVFNACRLQGEDKGYSPVFYDPCNLPQKLAIYHDVTEAPGSTLLVEGLDENKNIIRSFVGGQWINGFQVPLDGASPYFPPNLITQITGYVKSSTNGSIRIYYVDPTSAAQTLSAILEPDDISPQFRRYNLPTFGNCQVTGIPNPVHRIDAIVKYGYRPITNDNDFPIIQSQGALKLMLQAIEFEEVQLFDKAQLCEQKAIEILNNELHSYFGSGMVHTARINPKFCGGGISAPR